MLVAKKKVEEEKALDSGRGSEGVRQESPLSVPPTSLSRSSWEKLREKKKKRLAGCCSYNTKKDTTCSQFALFLRPPLPPPPSPLVVKRKIKNLFFPYVKMDSLAPNFGLKEKKYGLFFKGHTQFM